MGEDTQLRSYLVKELKSSGSEFGSFMADEVARGSTSVNETVSRAKKHLTKKAKADQEAAHR